MGWLGFTILPAFGHVCLPPHCDRTPRLCRARSKPGRGGDVTANDNSLANHGHKNQYATIELLTKKEAARLLHISGEQLSGFVRDGELRYVNLGRGKKRPRMMFARQDIDD